MLYRIVKVVSACDIHYMENLPKYQLIDKDWIINTLELVSNKKITIAKACENAKLIGMNGFFRISTKTFYKSCRFNNIKTNLSRGVAPKMKINEAENIINEYRNNGIIVGLTKMYYIINNGNERKCGFKTIQNIYDKNNWIKHKEKKETIYRCRFEAILVNAIWHVDIHYCKKMPGLMVYGIIDDKSRFLISLSLLVSKDAKTCANEMKKAIIEYGPVGAIWSDNGGENTGLEFVNMLKEFGIKTVRTNPYSPEQNGKIERLWQSFEKMTTSNPFSIIVFRNNYNNLIPNRALNYKTPLELFTQLSHWKPNLPIEYIVDNNFINEIK